MKFLFMLILLFLASALLAGCSVDKADEDYSACTEFNVAEFGAIGDGMHDDGPALRKVFAFASTNAEPCAIVFGQSQIYRIGPSADFHGRLMLSSATNVVIEGNSSKLVVHPSIRAMGMYRSCNIVVRNLSFDYSPLPFTQGVVTRIENERGYLEFNVQDGYGEPRTGEYGDNKNSDAMCFDRVTRKFKTAHVRISRVEQIGAGVYGVTYRMKRLQAVKPGDSFVLKLPFESSESPRNRETRNSERKGEFLATPSASIVLYQCEGVTFKNVTSYAAPSMTINSSGSGNVVIDGLAIRRIDDRLVAGCSDGVHLKCDETPPVIRNSYFEGTMDDSIHIKISGDVITKVESPRRVHIRHRDIVWDATNLKTGCQVMVYDHDAERQLAMARIAAYVPIDYRSGIVTLDRDVVGIKTDDSLYLQAEGTALIENCRFETQLQRCILTHQPTIIRDCSMQDTIMGIVHIFGDPIEGPPSQFLQVENCVFRDLSARGITVSCPSKDYDQRGDPQFICRGCTFELPEGVAAMRVVNSSGVELSGNRYRHMGEEPDESRYIELKNSPIRVNSSNRFEKMSSCIEDGGARTFFLIVGKGMIADSRELQQRGSTAVRMVADAAEAAQSGAIVDALAENVMTVGQYRRGQAEEIVTGEVFRERLIELAKTAAPQDTVVIYTHSHGRRNAFEETQPLGGIVMDLPVLHPEHAGTFLWDEYVDLLLKIPAKNVVVLTMSCFSGALVEYLDSPLVQELWRDRRLKEGRNFIVMTSQNKDLKSTPILKNGEVVNPFTYAVATALKGDADGFSLADGATVADGRKDGRLSVGELIDFILYTTANVNSESPRSENNAQPQLTGSFDRSDLLFRNSNGQNTVGN